MSNATQKKHIVIDGRIRRASTGRYVDRLIKHLQHIDKNAHRYTILLQPDDPWQPTAPNFTALPCPYPQFSFNPLHQVGFARQLRRLRPDVVHFTMTQQPLLYFGRAVTTTHDLTMFKFVRRGTTPLHVFKLKMAAYRFLVWWSHKKSHIIIAPTKFVAGDIASFQPGVKDKIAVTLEASEPPLKSPAKRPAKVGAKDKFILYVGTAFPHKNLPRLVDAFELLRQKHPKLKLVFVGKSDPHRQELADYAATKPASKSIIFTGFVEENELKWLYQNCAAYTFASLSEGFGLPPLEAMAYGAPVASSNSSCIPEVCGNAAHYFNALDIRDMAAKIDEVLSDKSLRAMLIKNGYQQLKKYSWERMAEETLTIYKAALREN